MTQIVVLCRDIVPTRIIGVVSTIPELVDDTILGYLTSREYIRISEGTISILLCRNSIISRVGILDIGLPLGIDQLGNIVNNWLYGAH